VVELIMRCGNIDSRYVAKDRMLEGAKAHRLLQKSNCERYQDYRSEVQLSESYSFKGLEYLLEGRADGIFCRDGRYTIDEIKTTLLSLELIHEDHNIAHWAQAKCYAYIFAIQNDLAEIAVQITYFNLETNEMKQFLRLFGSEDLEEFLRGLIEKYSLWATFSSKWEKERNLSIKALQFPFPTYRKGQRELAVDVYRTIVNGKKLFAQAPTGTGKTISVLFPAIKAMGEEKTTKIFYLTAKTITRQVAEEAFEKMRRQGLKMKTLTLTAKEKICFCEKPTCTPEYCEYAKGHYDRINDAILETLEERDDLSRNVIESYAQKHRVCPFELALDISLWADCIICDYNYVFDPRSYLRRFFADRKGDYVFLIDEAHNLVDRSREMFSARLSKTDFNEIKKVYKGRNKTLDKALNGINKFLIESRKQCADQGSFISKEQPHDLIQLINKYTSVCELMLKENRELGEDKNFLQLYFEVLGFQQICEFFDESYITFVEAQRNEVTVKLFCLNPSFLLEEALKRGGSAILFSATLSPLEYFRDILGGGEEDKLLALDSPFDKQGLCVLTADNISTKYNDREYSRLKICQLIASFVSRKTGNYIVYFPSYKYMNEVLRDFTEANPVINVVEQGTALTEEEREEFLSSFKEEPAETYVAFCVLGGIFSEGIDLKGSRLIGVVIVSVGLPQLSVQQNIIKDYFTGKNGQGFEYAYIYPGMIKVLQAAGRVIRSESDTGAVLLIDERYRQRSYSQLFPKHWHPTRNTKDRESLEKTLAAFWQL